MRLTAQAVQLCDSPLCLTGICATERVSTACFALLCYLCCASFALLVLLCFALLAFRALLCFALLSFALLCFALLCFALLCWLCFDGFALMALLALLCFACFALLALLVVQTLGLSQNMLRAYNLMCISRKCISQRGQDITCIEATLCREKERALV